MDIKTHSPLVYVHDKPFEKLILEDDEVQFTFRTMVKTLLVGCISKECVISVGTEISELANKMDIVLLKRSDGVYRLLIHEIGNRLLLTKTVEINNPDILNDYGLLKAMITGIEAAHRRLLKNERINKDKSSKIKPTRKTTQK